MSLAAIKDIECWLNDIKVYPPGHIFAGKPKGKAEKSCEAICEKLYKFNFGDKKNVLAEVHSSYHELRVMVTYFVLLHSLSSGKNTLIKYLILSLQMCRMQ